MWGRVSFALAWRSGGETVCTLCKEARLTLVSTQHRVFLVEDGVKDGRLG